MVWKCRGIIFSPFFLYTHSTLSYYYIMHTAVSVHTFILLAATSPSFNLSILARMEFLVTSVSVIERTGVLRKGEGALPKVHQDSGKSYGRQALPGKVEEHYPECIRNMVNHTEDRRFQKRNKYQPINNIFHKDILYSLMPSRGECYTTFVANWLNCSASN